MTDMLYKETDGCLHYHVDGFRCDNCGAELRWVVPIEVDYEAAARVGHRTYEWVAENIGYETREATRVPFDDLDLRMQSLIRAAYARGVDAALGIGSDDAEG